MGRGHRDTREKEPHNKGSKKLSIHLFIHPSNSKCAMCMHAWLCYGEVDEGECSKGLEQCWTVGRCSVGSCCYSSLL